MYIVNYALQTAFLVYFVTMLLVLDLMQPIFIIQSTVQINFLIILLENLMRLDDENRKDVEEILQQILEVYIKLRAFVNKMRPAFAAFILFQLMQPAIDLAVAAYVVKTLPAENRSMEQFIYVTMVPFQLAIFCFSGQHLTDKFVQLYDNLLQVCWYEFSLKEKRNFLIILQNVQQPVILKTYFTELSLIVFRNVS